MKYAPYCSLYAQQPRILHHHASTACSRTVSVQQREQSLASVVGGLGQSVLNFNVNFHPGNHWIQRSLSRKAG